ncbi:MAG TPA: tripartite tricarboxylate transporter substrate binding protein [Burkholderiales bacterium]|jgi:tripartite-type tricarboxylate transporter receptor subunit TctC
MPLKLLRACLALSLLFTGAAALAQAPYPSRPIRLIAPFPPGGSSDVLGRILAQRLTETMGQSIVVENHPGAAANIGHEIAAKSTPDGYTLLLSNSSALTTNIHLYKRLGFDPLNDFAPISMVATAGQVLVVHPSVPVKNVAELIALAKAKPGKLNFGSGGVGITSHISGELFKSATGVNIVHVPYKGTVQAVTDLVAGQLDMVFSDMVPAIPQIKAGKLRPLAVTSLKRSSILPEVPTMEEAGVKGYESGVWWALVAPKGTPEAIVARINGDLDRIMKMPALIDKYASLGIFPAHSTPQAVTERIRKETPEVGRILKTVGVKPE